MYSFITLGRRGSSIREGSFLVGIIMLNSKFIVFLSCVFIVLLGAIILAEQIGTTRSEAETLFQLSFRDMDFDVEITGGFEQGTYEAGYRIEAANPEDRTRIRSWGIAREKGNKTPRADPGTPDFFRNDPAISLIDPEDSVVYLRCV